MLIRTPRVSSSPRNAALVNCTPWSVFKTAEYCQYQGTEITVYYPHHPYCGKRATVIGWNRFGDMIYFVLERPNGSPFQIPVWMTEPSAAGMTLRESPRIDLAALRSLRACWMRLCRLWKLDL